MTRLFDTPDPNPGKVLDTALAQGILLWEDGLDEKTRAVWMHMRNWHRTGSSRPLELIALVAAQVMLQLYQDPGDVAEEVGAAIHDFADDYLRKMLHFGTGFSSNVRELGDQLAHDYSSCITIHSSIHGGCWYVMGSRDTARMELLRRKDDPALALFIERFKEQYPETATALTRDPENGVEKIVAELHEKYMVLWKEELDAQKAS